MFKNPILSVLFITVAVEAYFNCKGIKPKFDKLENCAGPSSIMSFKKGSHLHLSENCELVLFLCVRNKEFQTASMQYKLIMHNHVAYEGKVDICKTMPELCAIQNSKHCGNVFKLDLYNYRPVIMMLRGNIVLDWNIEHENGKSCLHSVVKIIRT